MTTLIFRISFIIFVIPELKLDIISACLFIIIPLYLATTSSIAIKTIKRGIATNNDFI